MFSSYGDPSTIVGNWVGQHGHRHDIGMNYFTYYGGGQSELIPMAGGFQTHWQGIKALPDGRLTWSGGEVWSRDSFSSKGGFGGHMIMGAELAKSALSLAGARNCNVFSSASSPASSHNTSPASGGTEQRYFKANRHRRCNCVPDVMEKVEDTRNCLEKLLESMCCSHDSRKLE